MLQNHQFKTLIVTLHESGRKTAKYARVAFNNPPVNALSMTVWKELSLVLDLCEQEDSGICGIVFYSNLSKDIFSAGNDVMELYAPKTSETRFTEFWLLQTGFLTRLYRSPLITIACIRGVAPAGGCGLSLCCDYRIMTSVESVPNSKLGLNEVAIGIMVPKFWSKLFLITCGGTGRGEIGLMTGRMFSSNEAYEKLGIIHELVSKEQLLQTADQRMKQFARLPDNGRVMTKLLMRQDFSREWEAYGPTEAASAWKILSSPATTKSLGKAIEALGGGKSRL